MSKKLSIRHCCVFLRFTFRLTGAHKGVCVLEHALDGLVAVIAERRLGE